jgi:molybdenum cofactor synthesis domain-containing protein
MTTPTPARVTACAVVIGNEVLSGRTKDANVQMLGAGLAAVGVILCEARVVADDAAAIIETVNHCRAKYDYVFTTGGIGPTHDDITTETIAQCFGVPVERNPEAVRRLQAHYGDQPLNEARLRMANIPQGATLIDNPVSQAPGFRLENVFVLAGVPRIAQAMFDGIKHSLRGGAPMLSQSVAAFMREGDLAAPLGDVQTRFPTVELGSYPFVREGRLGVSICGRSTDPQALETALNAVRAVMRRLGTDPEVDDPTGQGPAL